MIFVIYSIDCFEIERLDLRLDRKKSSDPKNPFFFIDANDYPPVCASYLPFFSPQKPTNTVFIGGQGEKNKNLPKYGFSTGRNAPKKHLCLMKPQVLWLEVKLPHILYAK